MPTTDTPTPPAIEGQTCEGLAPKICSPRHIPGVQTMINGRWKNLDGTDPSYEELMVIAVGMHNEVMKQQEWKYSHCEIEASCGGERALRVRAKVMARRARIDAEREKANDSSAGTGASGPRLPGQ